MPSSADDRLRAPYRPVRRVSSGVDAPWSGTLVALPSGETGVLVDAATLGDDWSGWHTTPSGHVLSCADIVRRADGHDALLPHCPRRLEDALRQRADAGVALTPGERVTIGVSILRGAAELQRLTPPDADEPATGEWWLTDAARPVLAAAVGPDDAVAASVRLIEQVDDGAPVWRELAEVIASGALTDHAAARLEDELFASAAPEPLGDASLARGHAAVLGLAPARAADAVTSADDRSHRRTLFDNLVRHVDADMADIVSRTTTSLWRRLRAGDATGRTPRGRPWAVAAGAASLIVAAGLLWPTGEDRVAASAPQPIAEPVTDTPEPTLDASEAPSDGIAEEGASRDLGVIAGDLLDARDACGDHTECLARVQVDPDAVFAPGAAVGSGSGRGVTLLDDFGGLAVLRADADGQQSQFVVIQRTDDSWLLRDVYVAQQP